MNLPKLSYFDFPFSQRSFCYGQSDAIMVHKGGAIFRRRAIRKYTLVGLIKPLEPLTGLREVIREMLADGNELSSVTFYNQVADLPMKKYQKVKGEYWVDGNFDVMFKNRSGKMRGEVNRQCSKYTIRELGLEFKDSAIQVFNQWATWAQTRHFMVFKGHYMKWLENYFDPYVGGTLFGVFRDNTLVGLYGGEYHEETRECQITILKHLEGVHFTAINVLGLRAMMEKFHPTFVHLGSTADYIKTLLGFNRVPSLTVDWSVI